MKACIGCLGMVLALILGAIQAEAQEKQAPYKFTKGEVVKYDVVGSLQISLKGSHADFVPGGIETPVKMSYAGLFENAVLEVAESDGSARMERRVRTLSAKGEFQGAAFKFDWDREKDKDKPADPASGPGTIAGLFRSWCTEPLAFTVDAVGNYSCSKDNYDQLVNRAGVLYWPIKPDAKSWPSEVKIAAPLLHDKVIIELKNEFVKTLTRSNRRLMAIAVTPKYKRSEKPPEGIPKIIPGDITFTVAGEGAVEFDTTHQRLHSVNLNLTIKLSGKGPVSGGADGDLRGEVTYSESQVYRD